MAGSLRVAWVVLVGLIVLPGSLIAQINYGDVSATMSGSISAGYSGDYGNQTNSDHSWTVGGAATISGYFYKPGFLAFNVTPFLNQSRANSNYQSISNASGVNVTSSIFSGTHFPGSLTYSKTYNSDGTYALPGVSDYVTHGNSDSFGVTWAENLPDTPSLAASFVYGTNKYSLYGTSDSGQNSFHSVTLHSSYNWVGFNLGGYYTNGGSHGLVPQIVASQAETESSSSSNQMGLNVSHLLPLHGSVTATLNRSDVSSDPVGYVSTSTVDSFNTSAAIHPFNALTVSGSLNYSDNLSGQLEQLVVGAGGTTGLDLSQSSDSLDLMGVASYAFPRNLQASAYAERRTQSFLGQSFDENSYGGTANYGRGLLGGFLSAAVSLTDNNSSQSSANALGFTGSANFSDEILGWHISTMFSYAQNVQTLLVTYQNSFYNYRAFARRRLGGFSVGLGAGGSRTALTAQAGTESDSQSYNATIGYTKWLTAAGSYTKASGQAIATGSGLVTSPIPTPILSSTALNLYGGNSYSISASSSPIKNLTMSGAFSKALSNTSSGTTTSSNMNSEYNALVQYSVRKMGMSGGFARMEQGFSGTGTGPQIVSSFYIGVSRWFNFF